MQEIIIHPSSEYSFVLDEFDGPLDLLLSLIKEHKLDIQTVKIADITDQYLKYLNDMEFFDMDKASDFVEVAATLLAMKAKSLVPNDNFYEDDATEFNSEEDFRNKLMEYAIYKEAAEKLRERETINMLERIPEYTEDDQRLSFINFDANKLVNTYVYCLSRAPQKKKEAQPKLILQDKFKVSDKIKQIANLINSKEGINFYSLFDKHTSKQEVITFFLAILELLKIQYAVAKVSDESKDFTIQINPDTNLEEITKFDFSEYDEESLKDETQTKENI